MFIFLAAVGLMACGGKSVAAQEGATQQTGALELPMPQVPDTVADKGAWVVAHFWDAYDAQSDRARDTAFVEQNVANFIYILGMAPQPTHRAGMEALAARAAQEPQSLRLMTVTMGKYLDEPNSPMRNEEMLIEWMEALRQQPQTGEALRARLDERLEMAMKNRPGSIGADFAMELPDGTRTTLHRYLREHGPQLVMFYDPECHDCTEVRRRFASQGVPEGYGIIGIDVAGDGCRAWRESLEDWPEGMAVAYCLDPIDDDDIYPLPALPSLYLFDADATVRAKDMPLP